jgi:hypothetical protein
MDDTLDFSRRDVAEGRRIVGLQRLRIERMKARGQNTAEAEQTLMLFEQSLAILKEHLQAKITGAGRHVQTETRP